MSGSPITESTAELDDLIGYNLKRVYMIFQDKLRDILGQEGLAPRSYSVLSLTVQQPSVTQSELARRLGIERSGLVAIVDGLESLGLLERVGVPGDRRVQALTPTLTGREVHERTAARIARDEQRLLSVLSGQDRRALIRILGRLRDMHEVRV
jgi:DNA-binding MarR family transcriptional regulator